MRKDLIFANAIARYNDMKLLKKEQILRLTSAADYNEALKMLYDHGYVRAKNHDIDSVIAAQVDNLNSYAQQECPSEQLLTIILSQFVYNNAKYYYKKRISNASDIQTEQDLVYGIIDDVIKEAIFNKDYKLLSKEMRECLTYLDSLDDSALSGRVIDIHMDTAMYRECLKAARLSLRLELVRFVKTKIDLNNFLTFLRCRELKRDWDFCKSMLISDGSVSFSDLAVGFNEPDEKMLEYLESYDLFDTFVLMTRGNINKDLGVDAYLIGILSKNETNYSSFSPFLSYYYKQLTEFRVTRMILTMIKNNLKDSIEKRLRGFYD